jgi:hypothetical protein
MASTQSKGFISFSEQLHAKGYTKGQGYDPKWFDQMSDAEKQQAEVLLIDALHRGDMTAADPLGGLATPNSEQALLRHLQQAQCPSRASVERASALWKATHDLKYQDLLIDNLSITNDLERGAVTVQLLTTSHTIKLLDACVRLVESDPDGTVRSTALKGALHIVGLVPDRSVFNHPYRRLQIGIASEDAAARGQALVDFRALVDTARATINLP